LILTYKFPAFATAK